MALLNYTTTIAAEQSIAEISKILGSIGAKRIMHDYDDNQQVVALSFAIDLNGQLLSFRLPTNAAPVLETLRRQKDQFKREGKRWRTELTDAQAYRVAWRITKDWVEAQAAFIETMRIPLAQVFLPYAVSDTGETLYERIAANPGLLLGGGK
jgi:hypothetical protein